MIALDECSGSYALVVSCNEFEKIMDECGGGYALVVRSLRTKDKLIWQKGKK